MTTVALNADQQDIRDVARRFLDDKYGVERVRELMDTDTASTPEDWAEIAEMGWTAIAVSEDSGGAGFGDVERVVLLEELGRSVLPGPFMATAVLAVDALEAVGATDLLASVIGGEKTAALVAAGDLAAGTSIAGGVSESGGALSGDGGIALEGATADVLVVIAQSGDGVGLFAVQQGADGLTAEPTRLVDDTRKAATVSFDGTPAERLGGDGDQTDALRFALARSTVAVAAELVGCARQVLDITLAYMNDRKQFGVPIGSFQALKHRASDIGVAVDAARETVLYAVDALVLDGADADSVANVVSAAKSAASDAAVHATNEAIQLHGGIGFTAECDVHLFHKRALVDAQLLGDAVDHRDRLATSLGI